MSMAEDQTFCVPTADSFRSVSTGGLTHIFYKEVLVIADFEAWISNFRTFSQRIKTYFDFKSLIKNITSTNYSDYSKIAPMFTAFIYGYLYSSSIGYILFLKEKEDWSISVQSFRWTIGPALFNFILTDEKVNNICKQMYC